MKKEGIFMFKERLKNLRIENSIKQETLAKVLNITTSTVSMYENGTREPSLETLVKISEFFNVTTDYLLGKTDNKN